MRRTFAALLGVPIGYAVFALAGYWGIGLFSSNGFDRSVEASMTAFLFAGPIGAVVGAIAAFLLGGTSRKGARS
jgi:hypothetical protein